MRLFLILAAALALAAQPSPVASRDWVTDEAAMLSPSGRSRLTALLNKINWQTGGQLVILTTPSTSPLGARDYAVQRFNAWQLGSAERNDGILILLAREPRAIEIVVGSGLRARLPHSLLAPVVNDHIAPALRDNRPVDALAAGAKELASLLTGVDRRRRAPALPLAAAGLAALAAGLWATFALWRFHRRPLRIPTRGLAAVSKSTLDLRPEKLFAVAGGRLPGGFETYPPAHLWTAALALSFAAGALTAATAAAFSFDLEPSFWLLYPLCAVFSVFTLLSLGPVNAGGFDGLAILAPLAAAIGGLLPAAAARYLLLSDAAIALTAAAGVALVNLAVGVYLVRNFYGWTPKRFLCESCSAPVRELTPAEQKAALPAWAARAGGNALFRGWRCSAACDGAFLLHAPAVPAAQCPACATPTRLESTSATHRAYTCFLCGKAEKFQLRASGGGAPGDYTPAATPTRDDDDWQRRQDSWSSTPDTPSSGGSTDGEGASGSW
jgi:uncharacterized membrane protein YgcG